ncbi:MAG: type II toxin-antitoxin system HicB family antitoxin [Spirochaetales bacterium]|nr:type II toxin-antitoxin system HicB family antitoxin [Spirochaetales bacterium]
MDNIVEKYTYRIEWAEEDKTHIAKCLEFSSLLAHGETGQEALKEMEFVISETISWMKEEGEAIPEPLNAKKYKGNLTLRVPPELHRALAIKALEQSVSINHHCFKTLK